MLVNSKVCKLERGFGGLQGKGITFEEFKIKQLQESKQYGPGT